MTWTRRLSRHLRRSAGRRPPASVVASVSAAGLANNRVSFLCRSLPGFKFMNKAAEVDPKKQKKMEKEEKEFRKKFKVCLLLYPKSRHRP